MHGTALALKEPEFKDGDGGGDLPEIHALSLTNEEAIFLYSVMEGCAYGDDEAVSIRNRLRVILEISPVQLVVDNG